MDDPIDSQPMKAEREMPATIPPPLQKETAPVVSDANAVIRLLDAKRLRLRKGPLVWIWTVCIPFAAVACVVRGLDASVMRGLDEYRDSLIYGICALTGWKLMQLANALDQTLAVAQTPLDKTHVGALIEALEWPGRRVEGIARRYLTRLLPTLAEGDGALVNEVQRGFLWSRLTVDQSIRHPDFVVAILQAAEKIGDEEAVSNVARLAQIPVLSPALRSVRQAARLCLPPLEQRLWRARLLAQEQERNSRHATSPVAGVEGGAMPTPEQQQMAARVDAKLKALEATVRNGQKPGMRQGFLFASWTVIVPYTAFQSYVGLIQGNWLQAAVFAGAATGTTFLYRLTLTSQHRELANQLAELDDIHAVGRLAEALEWPDTHIRYIAMQALIRLLPRLRASDSALLNASQRSALYRMLTLSSARSHATFITTLLKALEQIGDATVVPYVEALAKSRPLTNSQKRVVEAAVACLPYLQDQARQVKYSQELLRATSATPTAPQDLLRAAFATPDGDVAHLLRAGGAEEQEVKQ